MAAILEINDVKKYYDKETILAGVTLQVNQGEMIAIVGESGTGKTTLLSIIGLLQNPTEGRVVINEKDVTRLTSAERAILRSQYIGFVFQRARLVGSLTVLENVLVPAWLFAKDQSVYDRAEMLLCELGLENRLHYLPEQLSVGQMRRVALARALLLKPKVILADEPTNDLDSGTAEVVFAHLKEAQDRGTAVIVVTHDEKYALKADKLLQLESGFLKDRKSVSLII
jgi:ABC-type lipoprotein export system ATPase subunit